MVSAAALVLVLLHLHASDTLKEDNEEMQTVGAPTRPLERQPPAPTKVPSRSLHPPRGITREDEDLLDLMVRIAETPEEWERIHRVLSLIGEEKNSYETTEHTVTNDFEEKENRIENITENNNEYNLRRSNSSSTKTTRETSLEGLKSNISEPPTTSTPTTIRTTQDMETGFQESESKNVESTDTGWPDFEEAIAKKVKKSHKNFEENNVLATDWFEDDWLDPSWNTFLGSDREKDSSPRPEKNHPEVSVGASKNDNQITEENNKNVVRSRLYQDPKILEFPLKDIPSFQNHTIEHNISDEVNGSSSRTPRPVFVYHRVTTSPQERKGNSAFIAVSVVKQSPAESSATTAPPADTPGNSQDTFWNHLYRIQSSMKEGGSTNHHRKHPHWRQEAHWHHNRGRRHHHTHTHTQH